MLMITGQKPVLKSKQGAFQIIDTVGLFAPLTKFNKQVRSSAGILLCMQCLDHPERGLPPLLKPVLFTLSYIVIASSQGAAELMTANPRPIPLACS